MKAAKRVVLKFWTLGWLSSAFVARHQPRPPTIQQRLCLQSLPAIQPYQSARYSSPSNDDDLEDAPGDPSSWFMWGAKGDDAEEDDEGASSPTRLRRRRDRIKDWIRSTRGKSTGPMVRPLRMEDGSVVEDDSDSSNADAAADTGPSRIRANFGTLFSGMPSMNEILKSSEDEQTSQHASGKGLVASKSVDDAWFDEERRTIEANYEAILDQMLTQLEEQNKLDPEAVPSNAKAMIEDVLKQELKMELAARREELALKRLANYEQQSKDTVDSQDISNMSSERVDRLLAEDRVAYDKAQASQQKVDDYRRYELEAFLKSHTSEGTIPAPQVNANLDQWALEQLEKMADRRQSGDDDNDFIISDNIEESLDELRDRMAKQAKRGSIQPETMKEWQMYRAIASRLGQRLTAYGSAATADPSALPQEPSEEQIFAQLESWKEFLYKEDVYRKESGLARGPKLPFQWQELDYDQRMQAKQEAAAGVSNKSREKMSRADIRREVNRKSIEALESLLESSDRVRGGKLKEEIMALKAELESKDYLDVDEATLEEPPKSTGPVDISDVFTSVSERQKIDSEGSSLASETLMRQQQLPPEAPTFSNPGESDSTKTTPPPPPPSTPFFTDDSVDDVEASQPPPPNTPFFSDTAADESEQSKNFKLGTIEEQKLRAMYQRAGARTGDEKEKIRTQWEEFQKIEQEKRDIQGLSYGDDSELMNQAMLKYNVSDVTKDGDVDAEKILASIGPRPTRKRKQPPTPQEDEDETPHSGLDPTEVSESLYRAVSAIGGGRTKDDPEAKAREQSEYADFLRKEDEMRSSLDALDEVPSELLNSDGTFDVEEYAEDALASLSPRPSPKRRKLTEADYSDKAIALSDGKANEGGDDEDESDDISASDRDGLTSAGDELVPGWLRKERESARSRADSTSSGRGSFLGSDIDDVFDDDDYEHNMRQLAEYERRRAGGDGKNQMGIDIRDVLGKSSSEDYADYNFDDNYFRAKTRGWGRSGFEARKADLMEYTELEVMEVNALMDHKDSVYATGVSQYMPRINKPFKEFGAIFRMEGVLLDTTGFQYESWKRVASEKGFKTPSIEDVYRASAMRPDVAVREAFFWTDDIILCRDSAAAHKHHLDDIFNEWVKSQAISTPLSPADIASQASLAIGEEVISMPLTVVDPLSNVSEAEKIKLLVDAWSRTAVVHRVPAPTRDQVMAASVLSPDIAVKQVFGWSKDSREVDKFVASYRGILRELSGIPSEKPPPVIKPVQEAIGASGKDDSDTLVLLNESTMMELQYKAWNKIAQDNEFEPPLPEEVIAAAVINDPEIAIRDGFGWTEDSSILPNLVKAFEDHLAQLIQEGGYRSPAQPVRPIMDKPTEMGTATPPPSETSDSGPNPEEVLEMHQYAWKSASLNHAFQAPSVEQVSVAIKMDPAEAVTRLFRWSENDSVIKAVCATYESALKDISQKYIQKYKLPRDTSFYPKRVLSEDNSRASDDGNPSNDEMFQASLDAWSNVAKQNGLALPDEDQVMFAMSVGAEDAVITGFEWANDRDEATKFVELYKKELQDTIFKWQRRREQAGSATSKETSVDTNIQMFRVLPGASQWVKSLLDVEMQCAVVSYFDRQQVEILLHVAGLADIFGRDMQVTASDGYGRDVDQLLGAALRLERRPDHCVVFDSSPYASTAAHDAEMRSVSVIGPFPRYELLTADSTVSSFGEMTAMNIRRLFGERVYDQPMADIQQADPDQRKQTKTKYFWDDD